MSADETTEAQAPATPLLRVVKGDPTAEELAALVAVVVGLVSTGPPPAAPAPGGAA